MFWESDNNSTITTPEAEQTIWRMALNGTPGIGVAYTKKLIAAFGDAAHIFHASQKQLHAAGLPVKLAIAITEFNAYDQVKAEAALLAAKGIRLIYFTDADYPQRLLSISDAPPLLYYRGNADLNAKKVVAIVGTRFAGDYGRQITAQLIAQLRPAVPLIISGLATGIDATAHQAAIKNQLPTIGVLAHGLKTIYPSQNKPLAEAMLANGGLLTSYHYSVKAEPYYFSARNRLVAGMCDALIVVETGLEGGSMITVGHARSLGKPIFAVPGRLGDFRSHGCNRLIQQGVARLLSSGDQLAAELGWTWPAGGTGVQTTLPFGAARTDTPEDRLVRLIREKENPDIDELILCSGLDSSTVALTLLQLELQGTISVLPGKRYNANTAIAGA